MGSKVLIAAVCWLALCEALEVAKKVNSSIVKDNESAESAPPLYSRATNIVGVYASASPYGAYSYNAPTVIKAPLTAGSQVTTGSAFDSVPRNTNGYLKHLRDSYGKYLASPQAVAYKAAIPQQFLPIQALPAHLSQPLVAAATPNSQYRPFAPNYFFGTPYKVPSLYSYSAAPTPLTQLRGFSKPRVYAGNFKNLLPISSFLSRGNGYPALVPVQQQQATGTKSFYANAHDVKQKQQQKSVSSVHGSNQKLDDKGQIQAAPAQTSVTAIVNGKKTVVTLDTNPPIPQIDISLLEPLTFDNPVVPQVQHFLPKINSVTYTKLPAYNIQHSNKKHKDVPVHRINVYNSQDVQTQSKKKSPKKKSRKEIDPAKPEVVIEGNPDGEEFSYQINMPNHKETYNEQVLSYDKETNTKPVTTSYNEQSQNEPEDYSYSHSFKEPLKETHVEYVDNEGPKQLLYTFSPEEKEEENSAEVYQRPESEESSTESNDDEDSRLQREKSKYDEKRNEHLEDNDKYAQRHEDYKEDGEPPKQFIQNESPVGASQDSNHQDSPQHHSTHQPGHGYHSGPQYTPSPSPRRHKHHHVHHLHLPAHHHHHHHNTERTEDPTQNTESPRPSHSTKAEHRGEEYKQQPKQEFQHEVIRNMKADPHYRFQPSRVAVHNAFHPIAPEYEEDITILPTHAPHAPQRTQSFPLLYPKPFTSSTPHVRQQSQRDIMEDDEETPDEKYMRMKQVMAEVVEDVENEEEDFEKGYKASAFGFPAYDAGAEETEDGESDVNNPDSYGAPRYRTGEYNADNPFEKFQVEDDPYAKSLRSSYKDARDDKKENYYLDYSANKPDVYADFYNKKADYYKLFKKHNPRKTFFKKREERDRKIIGNEDEAKASSSFLYPVSPTQKQNIYNSQYKTPNIVFKYDYSKITPRDSRAHATQPYIKYRTNFVEPQFQYGFEPITAPLVLDSELAAMASNDSPESEKPAMRKKVYEENWYIKKTRTAAGKPS